MLQAPRQTLGVERVRARQPAGAGRVHRGHADAAGRVIVIVGRVRGVPIVHGQLHPRSSIIRCSQSLSGQRRPALRARRWVSMISRSMTASSSPSAGTVRLQMEALHCICMQTVLVRWCGHQCRRLAAKVGARSPRQIPAGESLIIMRTAFFELLQSIYLGSTAGVEAPCARTATSTRLYT